MAHLYRLQVEQYNINIKSLKYTTYSIVGVASELRHDMIGRLISKDDHLFVRKFIGNMYYRIDFVV